jgi:hypothetical protein
MNEYIYYPKILLDFYYLRNLVERQKDSIPGMERHHRRVEDDSYMTSIRNMIPILSPVYNIYNFGPNKPLRPHIDADRMAALNIPLSNTEGTHTILYDSVNTIEEYDNTLIINNIINIDNIVERFRFTLDRPTIINTKKIHAVTHDTQTNNRVTISWGFLSDVTFDDAVNFFESMRVL